MRVEESLGTGTGAVTGTRAGAEITMAMTMTTGRVGKGLMLLTVFMLLTMPAPPAAGGAPAAPGATVGAGATALDRYVAAVDPTYKWNLVSQSAGPAGSGTAIYQLSLTSQTWHGTVWRHRVDIIVPEGLPAHAAALLYITGPGMGAERMSLLATFARRLRAPVVVLHDTPNQPLMESLSEDALIAYTFSQFAATGDPTWPLLLPMVKGAVRAMDAVSEFAAASRLSWTVDGFVVCGVSKRGWTTWLTAAVDTRVKAIAPMAYDNLDLPAQMRHQLLRFGGYSSSIGDYTARGLPELLSSERGEALVGIVDPFVYRHRLSLPILIVRGSNDPYWPADAMQLYVGQLPGSVWLHIDANAGHGMAHFDRVLAAVGALYLHVTQGLPMPAISAGPVEGGSGLTVRVDWPSAPPASAIRLWQAEDTTADFRKSVWTQRSGTPGAGAGGTDRISDTDRGGQLNATLAVARPAGGATAVYGEVVFSVLVVETSLATPVFVIEP